MVTQSGHLFQKLEMTKRHSVTVITSYAVSVRYRSTRLGHAPETKMGRKPNQICAHCNQPIATPRKRRHVGYDGWLKGHAPLIIAMYKEGKGADTILGVLASKKDVILHYGGNPNWKMALRGTIFYILARHGFAHHGAAANRTIRKSASADARLIENYDDAA